MFLMINSDNAAYYLMDVSSEASRLNLSMGDCRTALLS